MVALYPTANFFPLIGSTRSMIACLASMMARCFSLNASLSFGLMLHFPNCACVPGLVLEMSHPASMSVSVAILIDMFAFSFETFVKYCLWASDLILAAVISLPSTALWST